MIRFFSSLLIVVSGVLLQLLSMGPVSAEPLPDNNHLKGVVYGALVADALCLGTHYEYDANKIKQAYGGAPPPKYMAPGEKMGGQTHGIGWGARNYHPDTVAGDLTDYGEYNVLVLEHLSERAPLPFDVSSFLPDWQKRIAGGEWKQWIESQTKTTFQQVQQGMPIHKVGGNSNAMHLRYAAVFSYTSNEDEVVDFCRKTMFTHREPTALAGNEFFARVVYNILHRNMAPKDAMAKAATTMNNPFISEKFKQALEKVKEATDPEAALSSEEFVDDLALTSMARLWDVGRSEPIKVGKASPTEGTLPGAIYFILKYQNDPLAAFQANSMAGGDNASRSIAIGMVLGAYHGIEKIPTEWIQQLNHYEHVEKLLSKMPLLVGLESNEGGKRDEL